MWLAVSTLCVCVCMCVHRCMCTSIYECAHMESSFLMSLQGRFGDTVLQQLPTYGADEASFGLRVHLSQ